MTNTPGDGPTDPIQDPQLPPPDRPGYWQQPPPPPYGPPTGYYYGSQPPPNHPDATTAMVLGIVAIAAGGMCGIPLLLAPVAWVLGLRSMREIDRSQGALGGRGQAQTGYVLGIVGTVLLALGLLLLVAWFGLMGLAVSGY